MPLPLLFTRLKKETKTINKHKDHHKHDRVISTVQCFALLPQCITNGQHFEALQRGQRVSDHQTLCMYVHTAFLSKLTQHKVYSSNRLPLFYSTALGSLKQVLSPSCHLKGTNWRKIRKKVLPALGILLE